MKTVLRDLLRPGYTHKLTRMLYAAFAGVTLNTLLLKGAWLIHVEPGSGGLLSLTLLCVQRWASWLLPALHSLGLTDHPATTGFLLFHYVSGISIMLAYFILLHDRTKGPQWWIASFFAVGLWLVNAGIVLPLLGQGFAGLSSLTNIGSTYFFLANYAFVMSSVWIYDNSAKLSMSK